MNMDLSITDLIKSMEWKHSDKEGLIDLWMSAAIKAPPEQKGIPFLGRWLMPPN